MAALLVVVAAPASAVDKELKGEGVVHGGFYPDLFVGNDNGGLATVQGFNASSGKAASLVGIFYDMAAFQAPESDVPGKFNNLIVQLNNIWAAGGTPFVNIKVGGAGGTAAAIASGAFDGDIRRFAGWVKRWVDGENGGGATSSPAGRSLIIAPLQEANWVGFEPYQCDPANFKIAYRKFYDAIKAQGIGSDQVRFSFAPNVATASGCGSMVDYYPGGDVVDFVGVSAYNQFGAGGPHLTAAQVFVGGFTEMRSFAPEKPFIVAQTAACSSNSQRESFIRDAFQVVAADPNAVGLIWFNFTKECDWKIFTGSVTPAWASAMQASATYAQPIADWFQANTELKIVVPDTPNPCPSGNCDSVAVVDGGARFVLYQRPTRFSAKDALFFGNPGDIPLMGDWDCNGSVTPGQYRQADGFVYLRNSNSSGIADIRFFFGDPGDVPIIGDFNGNGCDTVSIYRPTTGEFFIINRLGANEGGLGGADIAFSFGNPGDKPFVGDFDGNGTETVGLHRESTGLVYFRNSLTSGVADSQFIFGDPGDKITAGDWNGDGKDTVGVYRPGDGNIYLKFNNSAGNADVAYFAGLGFVSLLPAPFVA